MICIEAGVLMLHEQYNDDLEEVAGLVLSHIMTSRKGKLVVAIMDHVKDGGLIVSNPNSGLYQALQGLASLESRWVERRLVCFPVLICEDVGRRPRSPSKLVTSLRAKCLRTTSARRRWRVS